MTEQIKQVCSLLQAAQKDWKPPTLPQKAADMPQGDMPGDAVHISEAHRTKADAIFPLLLPQLAEICARNPYGRAVITVCGGSGSGKTGAAASAFFTELISPGIPNGASVRMPSTLSITFSPFVSFCSPRRV